jgi:molecular chaperone Hsp33
MGAHAAGAADAVLPFQVETGCARGRLVHADIAADAILNQHGYPEPVSVLLGEALVLTALLGAAFKIDGRFILQTSSDGPVKMLVVQYSSTGDMRGYASYDADQIAELCGTDWRGRTRDLLGSGHLAMTIEPGQGTERYQGVVELNGDTLAEATEHYFQQSEQIPTYIRAAAARAYTGGGNGSHGNWTWRAGGLMVQKLASEGGSEDEAQEDEGLGEDEDAEDWLRTRTLAATVEDHELLDPALTSEDLLFRLFHEEEVRVFARMPVRARCSCSRERIGEVLGGFGEEEIAGMVENGVITVKCEFCNQHYTFEPGDISCGG